MAISEKTRKTLWARSGNRCAFCRTELVQGEMKSISVVGDECHIIARSGDGPRGNSTISQEELDSYSNLILLCKVHHKIVDDQPAIYSASVLHKMKEHHETWVKERLKRVEQKEDKQEFLRRVLSGREIFDTVTGAHMFDFSHDELLMDEVELVASFLQDLQDYGDIGDEIDSGEKVRVSFDLTQELKALETAGFWVFCNQVIRRYKIGSTISHWKVAVVRVLRNTNPIIITIKQEDLLPK